MTLTNAARQVMNPSSLNENGEHTFVPSSFTVELDESKIKAASDNHIHVSLVTSGEHNGKYKVHAVGKEFAHGLSAGEHLSDTEIDDLHDVGARVKYLKPTKEDFNSGDLDMFSEEQTYSPSEMALMKNQFQQEYHKDVINHYSNLYKNSKNPDHVATIKLHKVALDDHKKKEKDLIKANGGLVKNWNARADYESAMNECNNFESDFDDVIAEANNANDHELDYHDHMINFHNEKAKHYFDLSEEKGEMPYVIGRSYTNARALGMPIFSTGVKHWKAAKKHATIYHKMVRNNKKQSMSEDYMFDSNIDMSDDVDALVEGESLEQDPSHLAANEEHLLFHKRLINYHTKRGNLEAAEIHKKGIKKIQAGGDSNYTDVSLPSHKNSPATALHYHKEMVDYHHDQAARFKDKLHSGSKKLSSLDTPLKVKQHVANFSHSIIHNEAKWAHKNAITRLKGGTVDDSIGAPRYESIDMSADVDALVEGESLSEEFKQKATVIFEAAVISKVKEEIAKLNEQYQVQLDEKVEAIKEDLIEKIDGYLDYIAEMWMKENEVALQHGIKTEIVENFISGMKNLFEEHYIDIPEDKYDIVGSLEQDVSNINEMLDTQVSINIDLNKKLRQYQINEIKDDLSKGLVETDKEKFASLVESIDVEDINIFTEKAQLIRENYFENISKPKTKQTPSFITDDIVDLNEDTYTHPSVRRYTDALDNLNK